MDDRRLIRALDDAFTSWLGTREAATLHQSLQESCELLAQFPSLREAVAFLGDGKSEDYQIKDALLRAFVEVYQAEGMPHRSATLPPAAVRPSLSHLFNQHAGRWPGLEEAELWGQIVAAFLEVASLYPAGRRPHRIAKNLLMDTLRRTLRWLHKHHGNPTVPRRQRAADDGTIEITEAMPYVLALVRDGVVNGEDAGILLVTRIGGERLPALARKRGKSYEVLRKRRQRAEHAIRQHLRATIQHIARRDGLDPSSVPLAEALDAVIRDVPNACHS